MNEIPAGRRRGDKERNAGKQLETEQAITITIVYRLTPRRPWSLLTPYWFRVMTPKQTKSQAPPVHGRLPKVAPVGNRRLPAESPKGPQAAEKTGF